MPAEQQLIIMQGASGSGKSTLARQIKADEFGGDALIYGTDEFFYVPDPDNPSGPKVYRWDGKLLPRYHAMNQERTRRALIQGRTVLVDNTNLKRWQVIPYVEMAIARGIPVRFVRCEGRYDNLHGVPPEKVAEMHAQMEDLSVAAVLAVVPSGK
jgi:predicted kinase